MIVQDANDLRHRLSRVALGIRRSRFTEEMVDRPFSSLDYEFYEGGRAYKRKKIILAAAGCTAATCTMCPIPNEAFYGLRLNFKPEDFLQQFAAAFEGDTIDAYQLISVYNSGNWFANREMPAAARQGMYQRIARSQCEGLMVESLPQFITPAVLEEAKAHLGDKRLFVGIGLQSADDTIRNLCINTTCTREQFERATRLLRHYGYTAKAYLMVKPPFLTEKEAVAETIRSIQYVTDLGYEDVSICPTRVAPYTIADELAKRGMFTSPSLWSIVDILTEVNAICNIRVACLDVDSRDDDTAYPHTCPTCTTALLQTLKTFNVERDLRVITALDCTCREKHRAELEVVDTRPLEERVATFIERYTMSMEAA